MKVTLTRQQTIPTEKFAPVRVEVSITDEIDRDQTPIKEGYEELSSILDDIMALETIRLLEEQDSINQIGYKKYLEHVSSQREKIWNELENK